MAFMRLHTVWTVAYLSKEGKWLDVEFETKEDCLKHIKKNPWMLLEDCFVFMTETSRGENKDGKKIKVVTTTDQLLYQELKMMFRPLQEEKSKNPLGRQYRKKPAN